MSMTYVQQLEALVTGQDWDLPGLPAYTDGMVTLGETVSAVSSDQGLTGQAGDAADAVLTDIAAQAKFDAKIAQALAGAIDELNAFRAGLAVALDRLPQTPGWVRSAVQRAESGTTLVFSGLTVVAGAAAVGLVDQWYADKREEYARSVVTKAQVALDEYARVIEDIVERTFEPHDSVPDSSSESRTTGGGGNGSGAGGPAGGSSVAGGGASLSGAASAVEDALAQARAGWT
ncbi:hypothetical protein [Cellulomonas denverensis]|uniref:hypothetical protein n=1 Tax=Cellulomonas denverensis TaxID=264297 RepID=UPI0035E63312